MTTNFTFRTAFGVSMPKRNLIAFLLMAFSFSIFAQSNGNDAKNITLDWQSIKTALLNAPKEKTPNAAENAVLVSIPTLNKGYQNYKFIESSLFENGVINNWIPTKCYQGRSATNPNAIIRIVVNQFGIYAAMYNNGKLEFIDPINATTNSFKIYSKTSEQVMCENGSLHPLHPEEENSARASCNSYGGTRRDYKVAMAVTGEYYIHKSSVLANVQSDITALMNVINVIYEQQFAIHLNLISNNNSLIYTSPSTDPFTPLVSGSASATQAQTGFNTAAVTAVVPVASYDCGQVLHYESTGSGWSGQASLAAICTSFKYGWNQERGSTTFNAGAFGGVMGHEISHNFGANHPFFGNQSGCGGGNINIATAYEPGSGTTYMSYQGICGTDDIGTDRDNYFHIVNLNEIRTHVTGIGNCATNIATGNSNPVSNSNPTATTYTIPFGTPFTLTGSGSDPDGNPITYCWEQYDTPGTGTGGAPAGGATNSTWPCFRSFLPSTSPSRTFPQLSDILSNTATIGEILPQTARTMKFRLTVRDAFTNGGLAMGSWACDETSVVVSNIGPFTVSSQNTATTWAANGSNTASITWNVNGTNGAPVNCANVSILFSTNGGLTFPYTLVASTPNNGSATITIPSYPTTTGRIKIQCAAGNIFFNINTAPITITSSCAAEASSIAPTTTVSAAPGAAALNLGLAPQYGTNQSTYSGTLVATDPSMQLVFMQTPGNTCASPFGLNPYYNTISFYVTNPGVYTISTGAGTLSSKVMNLYNVPFNVSNSCNGWITSNATWPGTGSVSISNSMSATLTPGIQYTLVMSGFSTGTASTGTYSFSVTPAANVFNNIPNPGASYTYNYVTVNNATGNIVSIGASSNLTNTTTYPAGMYSVYGLSSTTATSGLLTSYVGGSFAAFQLALANLTGGLCGDLSSNSVSVTITAPACTPPSISTQPVLTQTVCAGSSVSLSVVATGGTTPYTYVWKKGTTTITNTASITGATTATLTIDPVTTADANSYTCVVTDNLGCSVISNAGIINVNTVLSAPSVTSPVNYCQNATASALTATGSNLFWYTTATGGTGSTTAPTPSTVATGSTTFYVSQTALGCETARAAIVVTIGSGLLAPTATSPITYCQNATASALTATATSGASLLWYTTATGGTGSATAITPSTATSGSTSYYVSQIVNGCPESPRATIVVNVTATPAAPITAPAPYCQNATATALTATGSSLLWYTTATGGTGSATAPTPSTAATGSTTYYVSQTVTGCESPRASLVVTINALPSAPVTAPVSYCQNANSIALTATGTSLLWYTTATGGTGSATAPTPSTAATGSTTYYVSQTVTSCESPRASLVVTINALPSAPSTSPVSYCQNATASALTATGSNLLWYTTATGGTGSATAPTPSTAATGPTTYYVSQTVSGCESPRATLVVTIGSGLLAPTATSPIIYCQNATASALTATATSGASLLWYTTATGGTGSATAITPSTATSGSVSYYVSQIGNGCPESPRATIVVNVTATPAAPITAPVSYCQNATASALTATGSSLLWYTTATGGTGSATAPTPSTAATGSTTYYVSQTVTGCESPRATLVVTIGSGLLAPTATSPIIYCQNVTASALTATATSGASLLWYTTATGGTGSATAPTPSTATAVSTSYYVSQIGNGCPESPRTTIVVTINAIPAAPSTSPVSYCQNATASALTATGSNLLWYTAATGGTGSVTAPTPSTAATGSTTYYVSQTVTGCESPRATLVVTIGSGLSAPTVTSPVIYCQNATASALTATATSGASLLWYTVATGGTGSATAITPSTVTAGSTSYYVSQIGNGCPESPRATIMVSINAQPASPIVSSPVTYCVGQSTVQLTATGTALLWYTAATGGTGSTTAPTPSSATAGTTSYYVSQTISGCESPRATIAVTVNNLPSAPTVTTPVTYCVGQTASALNATGSNLLWYTTATGGTGSATAPTPSTAATGSTTYYVSQTVSSCESPRAAIVVTISASTPAPIAITPITYCQGSTATALTATGSNLLWYTTATGGTGSAIAPTPLTVAAGSTTYYVSQTSGSCPESARASIAVSITAKPATPTTAPKSYCQNNFAPALTAIGSNLLWYANAIGGAGSAIAPTPSTATVGSKTYYVSQTVSGCESNRATLVVTINAIPNSPIVPIAPIVYCQGSPALPLTAIGSNLKWYNVSNVLLVGTPTPSTTTVGTTPYFVSQTVNGCESAKNLVIVDVKSLVNCVPPRIGNLLSFFGIFGPIPGIHDPCTCRGDGFFDETVIIEAPSGQVWTLSSGTLLNPTTLAAFPAGTVLTEIAKPGATGISLYYLDGAHKSGVGYTANFVSPTYPGTTLTQSNLCTGIPAGSLSANDKTYLGLGANCESTITPELVLAGANTCPTNLKVEVYNTNNTLLLTSPKVTKSEIGKTLTVKIIDLLTNNATWGLLIVEDKQAPAFVCPSNITVDCNASVAENQNSTIVLPNAALGVLNAPNATDCSTFELSYSDMIMDQPCGTGAYTTKSVFRTWKAVDVLGNQIVCPAQQIDFIRPDLVGATLTSNTSKFECSDKLYKKLANGNPSPISSGFPEFKLANAKVLVANDLCDLTIGFTDVVTPTCGAGYKVIRNWQVADNCSDLKFTTIQIIEIEDKTAPVFALNTLPNITTTVTDNCVTNKTQLAYPDVTDNCSSNLIKTYKVKNSNGVTVYNGTAVNNTISFNGLTFGEYLVFYTATDECGNNQAISQKIIIDDQIAPTAVCRTNTKLSVTLDGTGSLNASDINEGSNDNCCLDPNFEIKRATEPDATYAKTLTFNCLDTAVMIALRVRDCNGNKNVCMATVRVDDKLPPVIFARDTMFVCSNNADANAWLNANAPKEKALNDYPTANNPGYFDNCKNVVLSKSDVANITNCGSGKYTRTWTATDSKGFTSTAKQTVESISMSTYEVTFPDDVSLVCNASKTYNTDPKTTGEPKIETKGSSCPLVGVEYTDQVFDLVPGACYKIIRTWKVINWCQNVNVNNLDPDRGAVCAGSDRKFSNVDLATALIAALDPTKPADVANPLFKFKTMAQNVVNSVCKGTDEDGYMEFQQIIKVTDNVPPTWVSVPDVTVSNIGKTCTVDVKVASPKADDCTKSLYYIATVYKVAANGNETLVDTTTNFPKTWSFDIKSNGGNYVVRYKSTDKCGNFITSDKAFKVIDTKKPTPVCVYGNSTTLMPTSGTVMIMATQINNGSYDNCTASKDLKFYIEEVVSGVPGIKPPTTTFITINCIGYKLIRLWVVDEAGNADFCESFIDIQQNMPLTFQTKIDSCKSGIQMATIAGEVRTEKDNAVENVQMNLNGQSAYFKNTTTLGFYNFIGLITGKNYNVTPELNLNPLNGITTYDLVLMNKHILGTQVFDTPYKWIAADINKSGTITTYDMVELRKLILHVDADFKNNKSWRFIDKDFVFPTNASPLKANFKESIDYNSIVGNITSKFVGVKIGDINGSAKANSQMPVSDRTDALLPINTDNQAFEAGQKIRVTLSTAQMRNIEGYQFTVNYDRKALQLLDIEGEKEHFAVSEEGQIATSWNGKSNDETMFTLVFKANTANELSKTLSINSSKLQSEAYLTDGTFVKPSLVFNGLTLADRFELFQNTPNPTNGMTSISFNTPEKGAYTMNITDASGRIIQTLNGNAHIGLNELKVELPRQGVYYYTVSMANNVATKKMIVIE